MLSRTTMELSTRSPTASARPASDIMLRSTSAKCITANVAMMETGMAAPAISAPLGERRKNSSTRKASIEACMAVLARFEMDC